MSHQIEGRDSDGRLNWYVTSDGKLRGRAIYRLYYYVFLAGASGASFVELMT